MRFSFSQKGKRQRFCKNLCLFGGFLWIETFSVEEDLKTEIAAFHRRSVDICGISYRLGCVRIFTSVDEKPFAPLSLGQKDMCGNFLCRGVDIVSHAFVRQDIADVHERSRYLVAGQITKLRIMRNGKFRRKLPSFYRDRTHPQRRDIRYPPPIPDGSEQDCPSDT